MKYYVNEMFKVPSDCKLNNDSSETEVSFLLAQLSTLAHEMENN